MGMRIDDEIYVHGYLDEIRQDKVIIRNEGGYFGTVVGELVEAIPKADYETRLKADLVAMLKELKAEFKVMPCHAHRTKNGPVAVLSKEEIENAIQQKINELKADRSEENDGNVDDN